MTSLKSNVLSAGSTSSGGGGGGGGGGGKSAPSSGGAGGLMAAVAAAAAAAASSTSPAPVQPATPNNTVLHKDNRTESNADSVRSDRKSVSNQLSTNHLKSGKWVCP